MSDTRPLAERCREAAANRALAIGEAWNLLDEAADALAEAERQRDEAIRKQLTYLIRDSGGMHVSQGAFNRFEEALSAATRRAEAAEAALRTIANCEIPAVTDSVSAWADAELDRMREGKS